MLGIRPRRTSRVELALTSLMRAFAAVSSGFHIASSSLQLR